MQTLTVSKSILTQINKKANINKIYVVDVIPAGPKSKLFNVVAFWGRNDGRKLQSQAKGVHSDLRAALATAEALVQEKVAEGYKLRSLNHDVIKIRKSRAATKKASVTVRTPKAALTATSVMKKTSKAKDARGQLNARIANVSDMVNPDEFIVGERVEAVIETCDQCKGKHADECLYCEGLGKQALVLDGINGDPTICRVSNVKFDRVA